MTTIAPTSTLTLSGARWRALKTHASTERLRYAMEYAAWLSTPARLADWGFTAPSVLCTMNGKAALYLPHDAPAPSDLALAAFPNVKATKADTKADHTAGALPDGTEARYFPPVGDVVPSKSALGASHEASVDAWRALFSVASVNQTCRFWIGDKGAHVEARDTLTDVVATAVLGRSVGARGEPTGLGGELVNAVLDAAKLLGVELVTIYVKDHRSAVVFDLAGRGLAIVMPRMLG